MKQFLLGALLTGCTVSGASVAGPIADLFRNGVFGLAWGASPTDVESALPGGKWQNVGEVKLYTVSDARKVFGIERTKKQHLIFTFSTSGRLNGVSVEFPSDLGGENFGTLLAKCTEVFGQPVRGADAPQQFNYSAGDVGGITSTQILWPIDEDITASVSSMHTQTFLSVKGQLMLNIGRNDVEQKTKEELGLN